MNIYLLFMSLLASSGFVRGAGKRNRTSKVRSVFDPTEIMRTFEMPKSCKKERREFCVDNDNYPIDIVKDLLENVTGLVVTTKDPPVEDNGSYEAREGPPFAYNCYTSSESDLIYYIVDKAGVDRVVVQLEGRFQQEFSIKMCDKEGPISSRPQRFMNNVGKHNKIYCQNKYMHYDFMVLSTEPGVDGKWKMEKARTKTGIPICCICRYYKDI